jgi:epoxyqueuosine reductase QueG
MGRGEENYTGLKRFCGALSVDLFGVADVGRINKEFQISQKALEGIDRAVCLGAVLSESILEDIEASPTRLYFHHYRTVNAFLDQAALRVCGYIRKKGYRALAIPASQILDWQAQKAHLSHKRIGYLAGLGWIGRNNLLVNKAFGSQFRLVTVLTNMPLKADKPARQDCADCRLCVEACPCGAIGENPSDFDHLKCFEKLKDFQKQRLVDQFICGVCVKACRGG